MVLALCGALALPGGATAQTTLAQASARGTLARPDAKLKTRRYQDPASRMVFEYPAKNWQVAHGGLAAQVVLVEKKVGATVVVEFEPLLEPLEPAAIDDFWAGLQRERIQQRIPEAQGLQALVLTVGERRLVVVQYTVRAVRGPDVVRAYLAVQGRDLYWIVCRAPQGSFAAHEAVFDHVAATFTATERAPASPPGEH